MKMSVRIVRLGSPRHPDEGLRIGTVRRPPRGVRREEFAARNYYDVWLPELAPSEELRAWAHEEPLTPERWAIYERRYLREMRRPSAQRVIRLLAELSHRTNISVGCYCENSDFCHRSLLRDLLLEHGATLSPSGGS